MAVKCECPAPPPKGMIGPRATRLSKMLRCRFNEAANEEGLFSGQQEIILLLKNNGGLTVGQVAESIGVSPATVSVSIKRMEKTGFVEKKADENDARITKLFLTEKGETAPERIREKMDFQEKYITNGMTCEEIQLFSDLLDRAINNLLEQEEGNND